MLESKKININDVNMRLINYNIKQKDKLDNFSRKVIIQGGIIGMLTPMINAIAFNKFNWVNFVSFMYTIISVLLGVYLFFKSQEHYKKAIEIRDKMHEETLREVANE